MDIIVEYIDKLFIFLGYALEYMLTEGLEIVIGLILITFFVAFIFRVK